MGDMDDMEGKGAMAHSSEECPDPLTCGQHDIEAGESLAGGDGSPTVKIEVSKGGLPSLTGDKAEGEESKAEEGLSPEEAEELRKLLR